MTAIAATACSVALLGACAGDAGDDESSDEDAGQFSDLEPVVTTTPCPKTPGVDEKTIKVGALMPKSGSTAISFARAEDGIRARFEVANWLDELEGRTIELVIADDGGDAATNQGAARTLVGTDKVFGVVEVSPAAGGSAPYLANHDVPVTGWHVVQPVWGEYPNMFTFNGIDPDNQLTTRNADALRELGAKNVAVVTGGNPTHVRAVRGISETIEADPTLKVVYEKLDVPLGSTNFEAVVQEITASGADSLYAGMDFLSNVALSEQLKRAGVNLVTVVPGGYDRGAIEAGAAGFDGVYFGLEFVPFEIPTPGAGTFAGAMGDRPIGQVPLMGWLSADMFIAGLTAAGLECPTREGFITNLRLQDGYDAGGLVMPVDFSEDFGVQYRCAYYVQVYAGQFAPQFLGQPVCGKPFDAS